MVDIFNISSVANQYICTDAAKQDNLYFNYKKRSQKPGLYVLRNFKS